MRVLIVQNDETESLGLYERYLSEEGIDHQVLHAYGLRSNSPFPRVEDFDAFIIGPTPVSANDVGNHDFLRREWSFLGEVVESRKPTLGVCCGGQMLARRLGGKVMRSPEREVGGYEVRLTEVGMADPLFAGFPREFPVFHWHAEMFRVPPGGSLLVMGPPAPSRPTAGETFGGSSSTSRSRAPTPQGGQMPTLKSSRPWERLGIGSSRSVENGRR